MSTPPIDQDETFVAIFSEDAFEYVERCDSTPLAQAFARGVRAGGHLFHGIVYAYVIGDPSDEAEMKQLHGLQANAAIAAIRSCS